MHEVPPLRGSLMVVAAACLWGTWSLVLRPLELPTTATSPVVLLFVGVWALPAALLAPPGRWDRTTVALLVINSAFDAINVVTYFGALERTSVAIAVLTHYAAPVLVALAAPAIDKVSIRGTVAAAAIATVGLAMVLQPWRDPGDGVLVGGALGLVSAFAYAGNVFVVRRLTARIGPSRAIAYHALIAAALLLPLGAGELHLLSARDVGVLAAAALVLGSIAGVSFVAGLHRIGSARAAVLAFFEPLVAVICGWAAFGEALGPIAGVGGALVLGAGVWVTRSR